MSFAPGVAVVFGSCPGSDGLKMIAGSSFVTTLVYGGFMVTRGSIEPGAYNVVATTQLRLLAAVAQFGLSEKTVKNYLSTVFEKLHVSRRAEAAVIYAQQKR